MSAERDQAELLLRKASEHQTVLDALMGDAGIADAVLGFHAQQAVEKALKAVLAARGLDFPWTHDLQLLLTRLGAAGIEVPDAATNARRLTPWAVEFRYGETVDGDLDRRATLAMVSKVLIWATDQAGRPG